MSPGIDALDLVLYVPLLVALVQACKVAGMPSRIAGLFAALLGLVVAFADLGFTGDAIAPGLVLGLSAAGLYSGGKAAIARGEPELSP